MIAKAKSYIARYKRSPLHYWRITTQETSGENLSGIGQSATLRTGRYGDMELHAVDLIPASAYQELCY